MPLQIISFSNQHTSHITHCHGRLVRCGETNIQLPRSKLKRLWEMSFKTGSVIVVEFLLEWSSGRTVAVDLIYTHYKARRDAGRGATHDCELNSEGDASR
jgi:hypothetical protein